jgi:hypothetical protein
MSGAFQAQLPTSVWKAALVSPTNTDDFGWQRSGQNLLDGEGAWVDQDRTCSLARSRRHRNRRPSARLTSCRRGRKSAV